MSSEYTCCELCPRLCRVDRSEKTGYCGQKDIPVIARAALHMWEEPCISGNEGSGTVFFAGCTLRCVYCQNAEISNRGIYKGKSVTSERLAGIFLELCKQGANNINLVTPTMFSPHISEAVRIARTLGMKIPVIYNTSCYERVEIIEKIANSINIWLPDFKYISQELSEKYSSAAGYFNFAKTALRAMVRASGGFDFDKRGMMTRGVIVRHLLLPGQLAESKRVIGYLFAEYGNDIYYSLMSQYTPVGSLDTANFPELSRRVTTYEYNKLVEYALSLGMVNAFIQYGGAAKESFIPSFNGEGV